MIRGDAFLGNVLVDRRGISAVMDFEFARLGPPDLALISFVRCLHAERRAEVDRPPILDWLREDYPEIVRSARPRPKAFAVHVVVFTLRPVLFWPPEDPQEALDPGHPVIVLRRLIDGPLEISISPINVQARSWRTFDPRSW